MAAVYKYHIYFSFPQANGWSAEEMFKTNQEKYNVQTMYDASMSDYT